MGHSPATGGGNVIPTKARDNISCITLSFSCWLCLLNSEMSPERYWRRLTSQGGGEGADYGELSPEKYWRRLTSQGGGEGADYGELSPEKYWRGLIYREGGEGDTMPPSPHTRTNTYARSNAQRHEQGHLSMGRFINTCEVNVFTTT